MDLRFSQLVHPHPGLSSWPAKVLAVSLPTYSEQAGTEGPLLTD